MNAISKMTSRGAIDALASAVKNGDKKKVLQLYAPDNSDNLPNWDNEPDYIWEEWEELLEKAEKTLGL